MSDLIVKVTAAVRIADQAFQDSGGSSRHWVSECFLPSLERLGLEVVETAQRDERISTLEEAKNGAYAERNQSVALLARMALALGWAAGVREHEGADWEDDWRTVLFVDLPTGQVSWHFHDSERHLLGGLPRYRGRYDGHSTEEKYRRARAALSPKGEP